MNQLKNETWNIFATYKGVISSLYDYIQINEKKDNTTTATE